MAESMSNPTIDPHSPYYTNTGFPFDCFFTPDKLSEAEDNYVSWKIRFLAFLRVTKKTKFIDGTLEKPDPSSPLYDPWERCDDMVKLWMLNSMTEKLQERVMHAETAHKMWEDIRRVFVPYLDHKIYELRRRIATMRQGGDSVATYYGKVNKAWMELSEYAPSPKCACGGCKCEIKKQAVEAREKEQRYAFLMGLKNSLSSVRTVIMLMKRPPSVHQAYLMVQQAESDMKMSR